MSRFRHSLTFVLALSLVSCGPDPAERAYLAALRGEEEGMGRVKQTQLLDQAIALQPRRAWYRETKAIYLIDLKDYGLALAEIDTAITLADRPYLRHLRGLVTCELGNPAQSLADFDAAIAGQPTNTQFYRGRSLARSAVGRYDEALRDAEHLIEVVPQQAESWYARGVARSGLGRDREALADFDEALRRRPELIYPLEARARAHERLHEDALAAEDRATYERLAKDSGCALCVDPFRY
jgi:tetratricopeptide (TPR) repeat protein